MTEESRVRQFLATAEEMARHAPAAALDQLRRGAKSLYDAVGIERPWHDELRRTLVTVRARVDHALAFGELPSVEVVPWNVWEQPEWQLLRARAERSMQEILYLVDTDAPHDKDPVGEIVALHMLHDDPYLVIAKISDRDVMFRKTFLLHVDASLEVGSASIVEELESYAAHLGLKCQAIP